MSNNAKPELNSKQQKAIEAMLSGMNKTQAASAAGVMPSTVSRWFADDNFRTELNNQSTVALKNASIRLKGALDLAVTTMYEAMDDKDNNVSVRLKAADMVTGHAIRLLETADLLERIEQLEERLTEDEE